MNTQTQSVEKVSDVIQVMQAGIEFYDEAAKEFDNDSIKNTFQRMIVNKRAAIESLQPLAIAEQGDKETGTDWAVDARKMYTKFAGMMSSDERYTYVNQLEEVEDKVLEALDDAISADQPEPAMATLRTVKARAQTMHDEMNPLQNALEH